MKRSNFMKVFVNILTSARVLGALIIIPIYFKWGGIVASITSGLLFITDFLDGLLARSFHVQSFFGSIIDAVSDKLLGISILIVLALINYLYILPILLELGILIVNTVSFKMGNNTKTSFKGKIKTNILDIVLVISLFVIANSFDNMILNIILIPLIISELIVIVDYFIKARKNTSLHKKEHLNVLRKKTNKELWHDLFDTDFYLKYRNDSITKLFYIVK